MVTNFAKSVHLVSSTYHHLKSDCYGDVWPWKHKWSMKNFTFWWISGVWFSMKTYENSWKMNRLWKWVFGQPSFQIALQKLRLRNGEIKKLLKINENHTYLFILQLFSFCVNSQIACFKNRCPWNNKKLAGIHMKIKHTVTTARCAVLQNPY